ncbi:conserved hypothetical protein [Altererythrobacter sp. B11]|uniref:AHH domain-containing protein n=1 Tax=Altererythrobacter sp. B11 TaxID=2060312 RepID=UPI000DC6D53D|nr:AHH domain-containing protein [Altererythrobacter sp. B11]BBC72721.1 conserved hypothetical protein [Altererythrobacter sp. B11]
MESLGGAEGNPGRSAPPQRHRPSLSFHSVNRAGQAGHDPGLQRHHLLPCQLLSQACFGPLFASLGCAAMGFDDFRRNGVLLPATGSAAMRLGLPLHRGPHRRYNAMVAERMGQIERAWALLRRVAPDRARLDALMRIDLLQRALRRRLLRPAASAMRLNSRCPLGAGLDFSSLDSMAEMLWGETERRGSEGAEREAASLAPGVAAG